MELSSRQMIILAAPLLISYLTWSTVDGGAKVMRAAAAVKAATSKKRSEVALPSATTRNPFSPVGSGGFLAAVLAEEREKAAATQAEEAADDILLKLNGTVITSKWRFAIINGDRVVEGQKYMGMTVEKIDPERVRLTNINGVPLDLGLQIEIVKASDATATQPSSQQSLPGISTLPAAGLPNILDALGIPQG